MPQFPPLGYTKPPENPLTLDLTNTQSFSDYVKEIFLNLTKENSPMSSKALYINIANRIRSYLMNKSLPVTTSAVVHNIPTAGLGKLPKNWHVLVRDILNRLKESGMVDKREESEARHTWKLSSLAKTGGWYESNPFSKGNFTPIAPSKETMPNPDEEDMYDEEGTESEDLSSITDQKPQSYPPASAATNAEIEKLKSRVSELEESSVEDGKRITDLQSKIKAVQDELNSKPKKVEITIHKHKTIVLKDVVLPQVFDKVLRLAQCRRNIMLVGPAGCGKSHIAGLVAKSLGLPFGSVSCTSGMSEAHFTGRSLPDLTTGKSRFQSTAFLDCYENGGVFLLDELDAADPNLLLVINTALANGYCNLPNRVAKPKAMKHEDFVPIATANTFGKGGNRVYAGRNQLDEATLDRFRIGMIECDYDQNIERALCPDDELLNTLWDIREKINAGELRRVMSTRFIQDAYIMKSQGKWSNEEIVSAYFCGWTNTEREKVKASTAPLAV